MKTRRFQCSIMLTTVLCTFVVASRDGKPAAADPKPLSVRLIIDYNDGVEKHFTAIPWKKGMTVQDAMERAKRGSHGITFKQTGSGSSAFLFQIDDLKNEGGGADKKNWILRVNKKLATESFGTLKLKAKDVIRWRFEEFKF